MRWHVHGTDASTGNELVLALDEDEATHAVQTAIAKRILVSHVTQDAGNRLRRTLLPLTCAAVLLLLPIAAALYIQNMSMRAKLTQAVEQQTVLAQSVAVAEREASTVRRVPAVDPALSQELSAARSRVSQMDSDLAAAQRQITALASAANRTPDLEHQLNTVGLALKDSQQRIESLTIENNAQRRRLKELQEAALATEPTREKLANAEQVNQALAAQLELLKGQLLEAAAKSTPAATMPEVVEVEPAPMATRWALLAPYGKAADFLALHADKDSLKQSPLGADLIAWTGHRLDNAMTLRFLHDKAKERLFAATITLSLASDAPREKLAENQRLAALFLKSFAPALRNPEALIAGATAELAGKPAAQRLVFLGEDHRLTVAQSAAGLFSFKIESPRLEADD